MPIGSHATLSLWRATLLPKDQNSRLGPWRGTILVYATCMLFVLLHRVRIESPQRLLFLT